MNRSPHPWWWLKHVSCLHQSHFHAAYERHCPVFHVVLGTVCSCMSMKMGLPGLWFRMCLSRLASSFFCAPCLPILNLWSTDTKSQCVLQTINLYVFQILSCFHAFLHSVVMQYLYCDWLKWLPSWGKYDMSHIILFPCGKNDMAHISF